MNESVQPPAGAAPGAALHAERRRQNISLGDVSRHLKLSVRQVEALERDDFSGFAGPVFVHGFIRNYAKLLGIDAAPLIDAADARLAPLAAAQIEAGRDEAAEPAASGQRTNIALAALAVVVVVAVAIYTTRTEDAPVVPQARLEPATVAAPAVQTPPADTPDRVEEPVAAAAAGTQGSAILRLDFVEESWVEVRDADGNPVFAQLNPAGSRRSISADPPLSLVVGNAAGVRLWYRNREIDLAPHTRVDVARLTLE